VATSPKRDYCITGDTMLSGVPHTPDQTFISPSNCDDPSRPLGWSCAATHGTTDALATRNPQAGSGRRLAIHTARPRTVVLTVLAGGRQVGGALTLNLDQRPAISISNPPGERTRAYGLPPEARSQTTGTWPRSN
jgi:hypothetical protein